MWVVLFYDIILFMQPKYFDIHSHLDFSKFDDDRGDVISRMKENGIFTISVGTDLENSKKAVAIAEKNENVFAIIGLHPNDNHLEDFKEEDYTELAKSKKIVGVGECGLDFFRLNNENRDVEKIRQINIFKKQIDFAVKHNLPLMIHIREAHK
ncbi:MAG: TatD family hydrolase, partial [Candidatus Pacebacteria bacterium]|nr:TatD family hydrolase [Candidatus Paceibacterota bacterium]